MLNKLRPRIVVSRCLGFEPCRYDGAIVRGAKVQRLKACVEFLPVCPELEIGLGVPRSPIHIIVGKGRPHLVQPATGRDLTRRMESFCNRFLSRLKDVDGFILKSRSPSCGLSVSVQSPDSRTRAKGRGFFARAVLELFPEAVITDERCLLSPVRRKHFLTRVLASARSRTER